jgi:hypothetical protein
MKIIPLIITTFAAVIFASAPQARGHGGGSHGYSSHSYSSSRSSMPSYGTGSKSSSTNVRGYTTHNGTYVAPHARSTSDNTRNNNWSTKGNINPRTGVPGTKPGDTYSH